MTSQRMLLLLGDKRSIGKVTGQAFVSNLFPDDNNSV